MIRQKNQARGDSDNKLENLRRVHFFFYSSNASSKGAHQARKVKKHAAINKAQGDAAAITEMANATALAIERIALAIRQPAGEQAVQLKVAEQAVQAYGKVAQDAKTTLIVPGNMSEVSGLIASAMHMMGTVKQAGQ